LQITDGGQIFANLISKAMKLSQDGSMEIEGMPTTEAEMNQMMMGLVGSVMSGDSDGLKRTVAPILANAEELIAQLEGDEESVLIAKRNKVVIAKLKGLEAKAGRKDAILYGAGHMPDLEKRLLKMGYKKTATTWRAGWILGAENSAPAQPLDLGELMKQVGPLMEMLKDSTQ